MSELEQRLERIEIDGVIDSGYIQELIKDAPYSPFETVGSSERLDVIAAKLLEGRIALFVEEFNLFIGCMYRDWKSVQFKGL